MAERPLLEGRGLRVRYRGRRRSLLRGKPAVTALDGVDIDVGEAECVAVVGESGSGKSTLARALVRLVRLDAGSLHLEGVDVTRARGAELRAHRRRVQMVFQDPYSSVNPRFDVADVVGEPLENHERLGGAELDRRVLALLERVRLPGALLHRPVSGLSGGQLQRAGIARALALDPRVIVADEPVSALDVSIQAQILNLFVEMKERDGIGCLLITHNLAVAEYVADRIAVMYAGRIVEVGPASDVVARPQHPYTRRLVDAVPTLERRPSGGAARGGAASIGEGSAEEGSAEHGSVDVGPAGGGGCPYRWQCPLALEACATHPPELVEVGRDHAVRCPVVARAAHSVTDGPAPPVADGRSVT